MDRVRRHEKELTQYALEALSDVKGFHGFGLDDVERRGGVISFTLGDVHPHDIASILDVEGIAIRSGHHCAQPLMERLNVPATAPATCTGGRATSPSPSGTATPPPPRRASPSRGSRSAPATTARRPSWSGRAAPGSRGRLVPVERRPRKSTASRRASGRCWTS